MEIVRFYGGRVDGAETGFEADSLKQGVRIIVVDGLYEYRDEPRGFHLLRAATEADAATVPVVTPMERPRD